MVSFSAKGSGIQQPVSDGTYLFSIAKKFVNANAAEKIAAYVLRLLNQEGPGPETLRQQCKCPRKAGGQSSRSGQFAAKML